MAIHRTESFHNDIDRYSVEKSLYVFTKSSTWAQVDTDQDFWAYGNWANPATLSIVSYAEGDLTVLRCDTADEFKSEITRMACWHAKQDSFLRIDCKEKDAPLWVALDLKEYMADQLAVI